LSWRDAIRAVSTGRLELSNSIQCLFSQRGRVARDCDLADTLDVRHTTVERRDQLTQETKCARSVGFTGGFLVGHRIPLLKRQFAIRDAA
jgi:hypothetical protein